MIKPFFSTLKNKLEKEQKRKTYLAYFKELCKAVLWRLGLSIKTSKSHSQMKTWEKGKSQGFEN